MLWIHEEEAQTPFAVVGHTCSLYLKISEEQKCLLMAAGPLVVLKESNCFANIIINLEVIYFQVPQ